MNDRASDRWRRLGSTIFPPRDDTREVLRELLEAMKAKEERDVAVTATPDTASPVAIEHSAALVLPAPPKPPANKEARLKWIEDICAVRVKKFDEPALSRWLAREYATEFGAPQTEYDSLRRKFSNDLEGTQDRARCPHKTLEKTMIRIVSG